MTYDPQRPIDPEGVRRDLEEIVRQGFRVFDHDALGELSNFSVCLELTRPDIATPDDQRLSATTIRRLLARMVHEVPEDLVRRDVAEAIFGMDDETAGLTLEGRETVAGRRYSPAKPVGFHGIRKRPYGQHPKLLAHLTERLIALEQRQRTMDRYADYSDWGGTDPPPADGGSIAVIMTEDGPFSRGGVVRDQGNAPAMLSDSELEAAVGYRWLEYDRILEVNDDLSTLTVTTNVLIKVKARGARLFVHRFPGWEDLGVRYAPPRVLTEPAPDCTPLVYVGRAPYSAHHPTWWLDYFDFGPGCEYDEQIKLTFDHVYDNPRRHVPHALAATPEFDEIQMFALSAVRVTKDGSSEKYGDPFFGHCPPRGKQHILLVNAPGDQVRFHLKDPTDWPRFSELREKISALEDMLCDLDFEMREMLRATETDSGLFDKRP